MKKLLILLTVCVCSFAQTKAVSPVPSLLRPSSLTRKAPEEFKVRFTTTKGDVVLQIHRDWAPRGADRFYNLVRYAFFTDVAFFRVIPGFMAQFGMSPDPKISAAWEPASIMDDPVKHSNTRGTITFAATSAPNSRTTQLFINFANNAPLDKSGFAPIGEVIEGMDVVDKINPEYREQPDQGQITAAGKPYLDRNFPHLDYIKKAVIVPETAPAGTDKAAPKAATTAKQ